MREIFRYQYRNHKGITYHSKCKKWLRGVLVLLRVKKIEIYEIKLTELTNMSKFQSI